MVLVLRLDSMWTTISNVLVREITFIQLKFEEHCQEDIKARNMRCKELEEIIRGWYPKKRHAIKIQAEKRKQNTATPESSMFPSWVGGDNRLSLI
jgi:uncharacterized protein YqfB (UPF0267 family)